MSQAQSGSETAAAALVGSLTTFSLVDVLDLLARTNHTGELQVVGRGVDHRVWVDRGDLVSPGVGSPDAALFELACLDDGWFYFTSVGATPEGPRMAVSQVLDGLGPQVEEWRDLTAVLPPDTVVKMSSSTPSAEVQIRADQWQLLSLVGSTGQPVSEVVTRSTAHPLDTLRTLRELVDARLLAAEPPDQAPLPPLPPLPGREAGPVGTPGVVTTAPFARPAAQAVPAVQAVPAAVPGIQAVPAVPAEPVFAPITPITPGTPITAPVELPPLPEPPDPGSPSASAPPFGGFTGTAQIPGAPPAEPPAMPEEDPWAPGPAAPGTWSEGPQASVYEPVDPYSSGGSRAPMEPIVESVDATRGSVMPPPITGDPWSSSIIARSDTGDDTA